MLCFMNVDEQLFLYLNDALSGQWTSVFFTIATRLGNGWVLAALVVGAFYFFDRSKLRTHLIPMALSVALGGIVVSGVKVAVDRQRPANHFADQSIKVHTPLGTPSDKSFPSGHCQSAFGAAVFLSLLYLPLSPFFLSAALLVGLSRIALGVHFPLDVLIGAITGAIFSALGFYLNCHRLTKKNKLQK